MKLNLSELERTSKKAPIPGTVEGKMQAVCPACLKLNLLKIKPCCGSPKGYLACPACGYKETLR